MSKKDRRKAFDPLNPLDIGNYNNSRYFNFYYNYLIEMATSLFEWHNLPSSVNSWFIEMELLTYGGIIYFHDDTLGDIVSNATMDGKLNLYNEPVGYRTVNVNYPQHHFNAYWGQPLTAPKSEYCVAIANSNLKRPYMQDIRVFAQDLAEICSIQAINLNAQKTPIVNFTNRWNNMNAKALASQLDQNPLNIVMSDSFDPDSISTIDMHAQYLVDKFEIQKHSKWNEIMTFLGINNSNQDKKERVTEKETVGNNPQVEIAKYNRLAFRKLACERINELFGTNISVSERNIDTSLPSNNISDDNLDERGSDNG